MADVTQRDSDRREHRRHHVANLRLSTPVRGDVLNASQLGMAIETHESLNVGWSYAFRMRHGSEIIRIPGRVRWCRMIDSKRVGREEFLPVFRMGIELAGNLWGKPRLLYYP